MHGQGTPLIPATPARRALLAVALVSMSAAMTWWALAIRVDHGVESLLPASGQDIVRLRQFQASFGQDEVIVLALHSDRLFTREGLQELDKLTRQAASFACVARVTSPTNARDLDGDELGPYEVRPYEKVLSGKMQPEELGRALATHPIYGGLLVGPVSGSAPTSAGLLIELASGQGSSDCRARVVRKARSLADNVGSGITARVAGIPVEKADLARAVERDQRVFAPVILGVLAAASLALHRRPAGLLMPLAVVVASLLWTLGLCGMAGKPLDVVSSLITPVILVVSVQGAFHLMNHHLAARSEGTDGDAAIRQAVARSWLPCLSAAATTAIGFLSLWMLPIPAIREFGLFTAAGVMISYVLTMTLGPILLAWLPTPATRPDGRPRRRRVERALRATARWIQRRPALAAVLVVTTLAIAVAGLTRLRVETDMIRALRKGSPLHEATHFIDRHLTGVNSLEILVGGVSPSDLEGLGRVARFESDLRAMPGIRKVTGLPDLYARANRAFHGGDDAFERLPDGQGAEADLADIRELLAREASQEMARLVSADGSTLRLAARATALDSASSQALFGRIRDAGRRAGLPRVELTGSFVVFSNMSTYLVRNFLAGLAPALALVLAALCLQFRSLRLGLLCLIPSAASLLMVYGLMGWAGIALSVPTAMIACVALGMSDDSTIHLMAPFRGGLAGQGRDIATFEEGIETSGRAVVFSTCTLVAGFWVGALSSFVPSVHFALLTGAALLLGLAGVAVILPLALVLFGRARASTAALASTAGPRAALGILLLALPLAAMNSHPAWAVSTPTESPITLVDQFGNLDGPTRHHGRMVLLFYGKAAQLRRMKVWELEVNRPPHEGMKVLRAVDARDVKGKKTEAEVAERLRKGVPPDISILVDWDGELARAYGLPNGVASVTVIDPTGRPCATEAGPVAAASAARVIDLIERVGREGRCP